MTFEELRIGSEFHRVNERSGGFQIFPANDSEECLQRFHEIVAEAQAIVAASGYEVFLTKKAPQIRKADTTRP
jgi:hypothetical protein